MKKKANKKRICRHCGGPFRYDIGEVRCLMCSRSSDHRCDRCRLIGKNDSQQKSQYKAA